MNIVQHPKVFIEINGDQHYKMVNWYKRISKRSGNTPEEEFENRKKLDRIKRKFARKHGIYIEIDLRKIKTLDKAIKYIEKRIK